MHNPVTIKTYTTRTDFSMCISKLLKKKQRTKYSGLSKNAFNSKQRKL